LPTKFRPQEVSDWIKSKKKDVVPVVKPAQFGNQFMDWWMMMQPGWRKDDTRSLVSLVLFRDIPQGETWQGLRKGGTAGIYVVVMGLSWWIKAQGIEHDDNVRSAVEEVLWVLRQMNEYSPSRAPAPKKRALDVDGDGKDEGLQRKR
jgi:hypothetical protein